MMQKLAKNIYLDFLGIRSSLLTPAEMSLDVKKLFLNLEELFLIPEMSVGRPRDREKIVNQRKMNQRIFFFNFNSQHLRCTQPQPNELNWIKNILKHILEWLTSFAVLLWIQSN